MASKSEALSPLALIFLGVGAVSLAATAIWFTARAQGALIYGLIRSIELPVLSSYLPFAEYFTLKSLRGGTVPAFHMIYLNSIVYGLIFAALIFVIAFVALGRLERFHIKKHIEITDKAGIEHGRGYEEIMKRYATTQPDVQFFIDYDLIDLSLIYGVGRQAMTALDFLVYSGGIKSVVVDAKSGSPPYLVLDEAKLRDYYVNRQFGPRNPFMAITAQRLLDVDEIRNAVDLLRWDVAILLYATLHRFQAFYVEADSAGYKKINGDVKHFIQSVWKEINELKVEFGRGVELGYDSPENRREREERYKIWLTTNAKDKGNEAKKAFSANISIENISHFARVQADGARDRSIAPDHINSDLRDKYGEKGAWKGKDKKKRSPDDLLFVGEVLSVRAPHFKSVAQARKGLKEILCRHLSGKTGDYPVGIDEKTKTVTYKKIIANGEEQAFNIQAQQRLNDAAARMTKIIFGHTWSFGMVGDALETVRESGIMPPNLFRFLRFSRETSSMWWFVQNLGSPSAYPENAALMEHYNAERATGMALLRPYIHSTFSGLKIEAEKYMTVETTDELIKVLGKGALVDLLKKRRGDERNAMKVAATATSDVRREAFSSAAYTDEFFDTMPLEADEPKASSQKSDSANQLDLDHLAGVAAEQSGKTPMEIMREQILPNQFGRLMATVQQGVAAKGKLNADGDDA